LENQVERRTSSSWSTCLIACLLFLCSLGNCWSKNWAAHHWLCVTAVGTHVWAIEEFLWLSTSSWRRSSFIWSLLGSLQNIKWASHEFQKDLKNRNLLQEKSLKLEKIMNEKMSKRRIQITDLQKQEIEEKEERRLLIRLHIFYLILLINLWTNF